MSQYLRADRKNGREYWWLVEGHREGKRVAQRRLKYFGKNKPPILAAARWQYEMGKAV